VAVTSAAEVRPRGRQRRVSIKSPPISPAARRTGRRLGVLYKSVRRSGRLIHRSRPISGKRRAWTSALTMSTDRRSVLRFTMG
jgi:hypothetical protein